MNKKQVIFCGVIALLLVQIPAIRAAEETKIKREIQLTTYYPAPHGDYKNINTTGDTRLATSSGNVGIGTTSPASSAKLEVNDTLRLTPVSGDAATQTGGVEGAIRYSKDASGEGVGGLLYKNASGWMPLAGGSTGGFKVVKSTYHTCCGSCVVKVDCGAGYQLIRVGLGSGGDAEEEALKGYAGANASVGPWSCYGSQTCQYSHDCKDWAMIGLCAPKAS